MLGDMFPYIHTKNSNIADCVCDDLIREGLLPNVDFGPAKDNFLIKPSGPPGFRIPLRTPIALQCAKEQGFPITYPQEDVRRMTVSEHSPF